jgi:hypothetical protein
VAAEGGRILWPLRPLASGCCVSIAERARGLLLVLAGRLAG